MDICNDGNDGNDGEAFSLSDLWKASKFTSEAERPTIHSLEKLGKCRTLQLNSYCTAKLLKDCRENGQRGFGSTKTLELRFPDLETFQYGPLDNVSASEASTIFSLDEEPEKAEISQNDIWVDVGSHKSPPRDQWLKTWEAFHDPSFKEPLTYISEAGPRVFDAALFRFPKLLDFGDDTPSCRAIATDPMLRALLQLGVGRQSSQFVYDVERQSFVSRNGGSRVSGYSMDVFESVTARFMTYGNNMVKLRSFIDKAYKTQSPCAALIAVAATVSSISSAVLEHMWRYSYKTQSILQLQASFDRPGELMSCLCDMTKKISETNSDEMILSIVFDFVQALEYAVPWLRPIVLQILSSISKPWLGSLSRSIGLLATHPTASGEPFAWYGGPEKSVGNGVDDNPMDQAMPKFIGEKENEMIVESRQNLKLLQSHSPEHFMLNPSHGKALEMAKLTWHFDWADVERIEANAKRYELGVLKALSMKHRTLPPTRRSLKDELLDSHLSFDPFGAPPDWIFTEISKSSAVFEQPPPMNPRSVDFNPFQKILVKAFAREEADPADDNVFAPALSVTPLLSFSPILAAQSRLLSLSCLRMLFKEHNLRTHLQLQRRFHLFGDGMFTSRLSHALFDPELESAERRKGHVRTGLMGLKLGSRDSWPPASSELRLVLMGILTESYYSTIKPDVPGLNGAELPGGLSFALRDLSEEEIQKCMELHSLEALDFLRLQYKAPSPLGAIITPSCLEKYDAIFRLLLRTTRMQFVVNQLGRIGTHHSRSSPYTDPIATRFRVEAHYFVSTIGEYFSTVAIGSKWNQFEYEVEGMEQKLFDDDFAGKFGGHEGLCQLRQRHEQMLNSIMFALLSCKRQQQAVKLLEDIFGLILAYNKSITLGIPKGSSASVGVSVDHMYHEFGAKIRAFINTCKGLVEQEVKRTSNTANPRGLCGRESARRGDASALTQLLLRLEMNDHYSKAFRQPLHQQIF